MARKGSNKGYKSVDTSDWSPFPAGVRELAKARKHVSVEGIKVSDLVTDEEWQGIKKSALRSARHHCQACGRYVSHTPATEDYLIVQPLWERDDLEFIYNLKGYLAFCRECFFYANPFIPMSMVEEQSLNLKQFHSIVRRGDNLLTTQGFGKEVLPNRKTVYRLNFRGFFYITDYSEQVARYAIERGVRVVHLKRYNYCLPIDWYYHKPLE